MRIRVVDRGPGISDEVRGHMFEPFFTTRRSGAGLGLAIAQGVVQGHGGRIRVDSKPGRGTRVTVEIPAQDAQAESRVAS